MLLDGPWGSGKSTFVQMWAGLLRKRGIPVVEFDAFGADHHEDAFIPLAANILALARPKVGGERVESFLGRSKKVALAVMPGVAKMAVRAATAGLVDAGEVATALGEGAKAAGEVGADFAEKAIARRMVAAEEEQATLQGFRESLDQLALDLAASLESEGNKNYRRPLVVIIDELDRCRPPFALSVIERVKHLFSRPNVVFVLVTNSEQLEAAVKGAYGERTKAREYLEKFHTLRVHLPAGDAREAVTEKYFRHLLGQMEISLATFARELALHLIRVHRVGFRTLERIFATYALAVASAGSGRPPAESVIVYLSFLRWLRRELFEQARQGILSSEEVTHFLSFGQWDRSLGDVPQTARITELYNIRCDYRHAVTDPWVIDRTPSRVAPISTYGRLLDDLPEWAQDTGVA